MVVDVCLGCVVIGVVYYVVVYFVCDLVVVCEY